MGGDKAMGTMRWKVTNLAHLRNKTGIQSCLGKLGDNTLT